MDMRIAKMQGYYTKHFPQGLRSLYGLTLGEMEALYELGNDDICSALHAAFQYGQAKGYRAAHSRAKRARTA